MTQEFTLTQAYDAVELTQRGITLPDARMVYVDRTVDLQRVLPGAVLYPGARLVGPRTFVGAQAHIGTEGPATLINSAVDAGCQIGSGFVNGAVLFRGAKLGGSTHVRPSTILEEEASVAHCVGLKQTVLMSFATLGSLINACDLLIGGGTSREKHTEIGSGFIHFNFTPWGERGDKATPTLIGNVHEGAFLRSERIFIGGLSGIVGPNEVGFGSITVAGQVVRKPVGRRRIVAHAPRPLDKPLEELASFSLQPGKIQANAKYIGQLCALKAWYQHVRLHRRRQHASQDDVSVEVLEAGVAAVEDMITERLLRIAQYAQAPKLDAAIVAAVPGAAPAELVSRHGELSHIPWLHSLAPDTVQLGIDWLAGIAQAAETKVLTS